MQTFGDRFRQRRKELGYTMEYIADKTGLSRSSLYRFEQKSPLEVPVKSIYEIAKVLRCSPSYLLGDEWRENRDDLYVVQTGSEEYTLISAYRRSDEQTKEMVKRVLIYAEKFKDMKKEKKKKSEEELEQERDR